MLIHAISAPIIGDIEPLTTHSSGKKKKNIPVHARFSTKRTFFVHRLLHFIFKVSNSCGRVRTLANGLATK